MLSRVTLRETEATRRAREFGVDLTLTEQNLQLTPTQRLQKLRRQLVQISRLRGNLRGT